ncbi:MAG: type IV pili twitching motility protein PilT, partial [Hyphomonadaceae bacterium]|nr:type IV pili twitching motility protein PilT [Clostridia bacterium]
MTVHELLNIAIERGASDVHITVGRPPMARLHGELIPLIEDSPLLIGADTEKLLREIMTPEQNEEVSKKGECDFSFSISNVGRFRA